MQLPRGTERQRSEEAPNARWSTRKELAPFRYASVADLQGRGPNGEGPAILLGKDEDGGLIGSADDRHLLTVAGSRAGKSSTCLKPNLKLWPSSLLCIDPKGELAMETALDRAAMGQDVYILDPFGEVTGEAAKYRRAFNPLPELLAEDGEFTIDDAALLADALIVPGKDGDQHWTISAKNLVRGMILYALHQRGPDASLSDVRELITLPLATEKDDRDKDKDKDQDAPNHAKPNTPEEVTLSTIFKLMMKDKDAFDGVLASLGGTLYGKPRNERGSIVSTAVEQTGFLDSRHMHEHLSGVGLSTLRQLKRKPTTIYLVLPASRMATHFRWLRMILTLALAALEREKMALNASVLFVLEEFPQLGYMRQIEAAAGLMAGFGVKLWTVLQDLSQIKALYKDSWETFIGNAGVVQAFGNTDATTLEYISRALGTRSMVERQANAVTASAIAGGASTEREDTKSISLLAPFEVALYGARHTQKQILLLAGHHAAYINRMTHEEVANAALRPNKS